jgi:hypothetical protein
MNFMARWERLARSIGLKEPGRDRLAVPGARRATTPPSRPARIRWPLNRVTFPPGFLHDRKSRRRHRQGVQDERGASTSGAYG